MCHLTCSLALTLPLSMPRTLIDAMVCRLWLHNGEIDIITWINPSQRLDLKNKHLTDYFIHYSVNIFDESSAAVAPEWHDKPPRHRPRILRILFRNIDTPLLRTTHYFVGYMSARVCMQPPKVPAQCSNTCIPYLHLSSSE